MAILDLRRELGGVGQMWTKLQEIGYKNSEGKDWVVERFFYSDTDGEIPTRGVNSLTVLADGVKLIAEIKLFEKHGVAITPDVDVTNYTLNGIMVYRATSVTQESDEEQ